MAQTTFYEILELEPSATPEEIKAAYRQLSVKVHPDRGGSQALFRLVREAYETLSNSYRRAEYDRSRARATDAARPSGGADGNGGLENDLKMLADRALSLNKTLVRLQAEAKTDRDRLEACRVQLDYQMAQIAWNMAVFRQLSEQGKADAAARFRAKADEGVKAVPAIEKLIETKEKQIAEKARAADTGGSSSVRMIECGECKVRNRVSPGTQSFSCGGCKNRHRLLTCSSCGTQSYVGTGVDGDVTSFACGKCRRVNRMAS